GHTIWYKYMILDDLAFATKFYTSEAIEPALVTGSLAGDDNEVLKWQFDLIYKF
ncbi:MAG: hypothetical protein ACI9CF_000976, partial [Candidatus Omnitrophota bacterium]